MGWTTRASSLGFEVERVAKMKGKCPECGTPFDVELDINGEYNCLCGYFRWQADSDTVSMDNHGIPTEEWKARLREALEKGVDLPIGSVWWLHQVPPHSSLILVRILHPHTSDGVYHVCGKEWFEGEDLFRDNWASMDPQHFSSLEPVVDLL